MKSRYVAIEGNIGAGKTTLTRKLGRVLQARTMLEEFAHNPFLPLFYEHPERYAFALEMSFLADRYHQLAVLTREDLFQPLLLSDYSVYKSLIFAQNNLSGKEWHLYQNLFHILRDQLPEPDLVIYLHRSIEHLQHHIQKRGRSYEMNIGDTYLSNIQRNYVKFFRQNSSIPVVVVDADRYNFVDNPRHLDLLSKLIFRNFNPGLNFWDRPGLNF